MVDRAFVLLPLHEIALSLHIPGHGHVEAMLAVCGNQAVHRHVENTGAVLSKKVA